MGKSKKKQLVRSRKEEEHAKKVLIAIGVIAVALAVVMLVCYSFMG